jgi:4,5-dihydroxyphthalate decarboxylase
VPWIDLEDVRGLMGEDYWPYGIEANRGELMSTARWSFEEGLSPRLLDLDELFAPGTAEVEA